MRSPRSRITLAIVFVVLLTVVVLAWRPIQQARAVAAVQGAVRIPWGIQFEGGERPGIIPVSIDAQIGKWFAIAGDNGPMWANTGPLLHEQFRTLFRGPIDSIFLNSPVEMRRELGAALTRFPHLRSVSILGDTGSPSTAEWTRLFQGLRACRRLEKLSFDSQSITDGALRALTDHPMLSDLTVTGNSLTGKCAAVFSSLPQLRRIHLGWNFTSEEWRAICGELRKAPLLEAILLHGYELDDDAIAALAGHATLRSITIPEGELSTSSAATFAALPALRELSLGGFSSMLTLRPEDRQVIIKALPAVRVEFQ